MLGKLKVGLQNLSFDRSFGRIVSKCLQGRYNLEWVMIKLTWKWSMAVQKQIKWKKHYFIISVFIKNYNVCDSKIHSNIRN